MIPEKYLPFYNSTGLSTDTRKIEKDNLFVCIKGEKFNGNSFALNALHNGAKHVIVDDEEYYDEKENMTLVEDSVKFLQELANFHRKQFDIPVIGITGSNGKTTSKELINAVLSRKYNVLATEGNLNNHLGVPFTLLKLNDSHEIAIIEMGANKPGDIKELCDIAEPTYGIITNIGKAHLEGFKNFEGILKTKTELYRSIAEQKGTVFVNYDDNVLKSKIPEETTPFFYGVNGDGVKGSLIALTPFVEMNWNYQNYTSPLLKTHLVGSYNFTNLLAAVTIGIHFDVDYTSINDAIESYTPKNNRSQVNRTANNTLILDCYNANPTSMKLSLESFAQIDHPNKTFILGGMKELGADAELEHRMIIDQIEKLHLNGYLVGNEFAELSSENIIRHFTTANDAVEYFKENRPKDRLILLKGSRSIGLEILETIL